jgi:hypothetical protein
MTTARQIRKALNELDQLAHAAWERREVWEKENPGEDRPFICGGVGLIGRCTDTSVWLADLLGGVIHGYLHDDNPTAIMGEPEGGHDFVLVDDRWLVDWWAKDTYQERDLYDLKNSVDESEVLRLYGDPQKWLPMSAEDFLKSKVFLRDLKEG